MQQHEKLFGKSEVEYITPFLKLWMAFNSWYKKQIEVKQDRQAINHYKVTGEIKEAFLAMLNSRAAKNANFQQAVAGFVDISIGDQHHVNDINWNTQSDYLHRSPSQKEINESSLEFIADQNKTYYISPEYKDDFFSDLLENIYQVRCSLVHGDFDIENQHFIDLVRCTYSLLYPVMESAMTSQKSNLWYCKHSQGTDAHAQLDENGKMKVLTGSKIRAQAVKSYGDCEARQTLLDEYGRLEGTVYTLKSHITFESYSAASKFCMGRPSNGWNDWKDENGKTIDEVLREK